jgi:hypothetical protein
MPRKKSRTEDRIGIPKSNVPRVNTTVEKPKTKSGNKSGTRQQLAEAILASNKRRSQDPRSGSKKPIDLTKYAKDGQDPLNTHGKMTSSLSAAENIKYKTPQAELNAIEADKELEVLLEKQEGEILTSWEQAYVDKMTARYRILCELLGIDVDDYSEDELSENKKEDDPFANLDAIKIDDFKD